MMQTVSRFEAFIKSRRAKATRYSYLRGIRSLVGDGDAFLSLCETDRQKGEEYLISQVIQKRDAVSAASLTTWLREVRSLLEYYEVKVNWKRIRQVAPPSSYVALDRAPTREEIRSFLKEAKLRERVIALVMASSGIRVGAFDYLKVGHFKVLESGLGSLKVYAGEVDAEYTTFVTPECVSAVKEYMEARALFAEEEVGPASPFVRNVWNYTEANGAKREFIIPIGCRPASANGIRTEILRTWIKSRVRTNEHNRVRRHEFKLAHGFRKFAKTQLSKAGVSREDSEVLLGHRLNYYKPTFEHLEEVYLKAVPFLTIAESEELKQAIEKKDADFQSSVGKVEIELLKERDARRTLEERLSKQEETQTELAKVIAEMRKRGLLPST